MNSDTVFTFAFLLCVIAFVCAVPIYGMIRRNSPGLAWNRHGNVSTAQFHQVDLLGIGLFIFIFGFFLYLAQQPPEMEADGVTPRTITHTPPTMIAGMIAQQVVLVLIAFVLLMFRGTNFVELFGLRWKNARYLLIIAPVGVIIAIAFNIGLTAGGYGEWLKDLFGDDSKSQITVSVYQGSMVTYRILLAIAIVILAPIGEEIVFRGYIYGATKRFSDRFFATLFSALFFALVHNNINALLPLFFLALILTLAYELTGSLWAPISIHALFNATTLVSLEVFSIQGN